MCEEEGRQKKGEHRGDMAQVGSSLALTSLLSLVCAALFSHQTLWVAAAPSTRLEWCLCSAKIIWSPRWEALYSFIFLNPLSFSAQKAEEGKKEGLHEVKSSHEQPHWAFLVDSWQYSLTKTLTFFGGTRSCPRGKPSNEDRTILRLLEVMDEFQM